MNENICSELGCKTQAHCRGLCSRHYSIRRRAGEFVGPPEKTCSDCGLTKPIAAFSRKPTNADGYRSNCKPCRVLEATEYRKSHREQINEYQRHWRLANPEKIRASAQKSKSRPEYKARQKVWQTEWAKQHPGHRGAKRAVQWALEEGELIRPEACERCKKVGDLHAHHYRGYHPTHWLDVEWLCPRCHYFANREPKPDHYL